MPCPPSFMALFYGSLHGFKSLALALGSALLTGADGGMPPPPHYVCIKRFSLGLIKQEGISLGGCCCPIALWECMWPFPRECLSGTRSAALRSSSNTSSSSPGGIPPSLSVDSDVALLRLSLSVNLIFFFFLFAWQTAN